LTDDLLSSFETAIDTITLVPSDGGRFEVSVNGNLLFSKLQTHRHPQKGEVDDLLRAYLEKNQ
jgi:selenoprotein W-related protein